MVAAPLVYLAIRVSQAQNVGELLWRQRTLDLAFGSIGLAVVVTGLSVVVGIGLAVAAMRAAGSRPLMVGILATPLAIPSYLTGFAWTRLFPMFEGFWAAVLILTVACYPLVLLPVAASLARSGRSLSDASRTLGNGPVRTFLTVTLRQVRPAAIASSLLVALYVLGDFGGPASVRFESFTVGIYNAYNGSFDRTLPAVYSLILIAAALLLAALARRSRRFEARSITTVEPPSSPPGALGRSISWTLMAATLTVAIVIPVYALIREASQSKRLAQRSVGDVVTWLLPDVSATLGYALVGAVAVTICALPIALYTALPRRRGAGLVEQISFLGYTLPGVTVGLAVVFLGIRLGRDFYLTPALLVTCYVMLFLPLAVGPIRSGLDATAGSLTDAARTLGASPWEVFWRVRLPLVAPGILAGGLLAGLAVAKELPATLLLRPIGTSTLATHMWSLSNDGATGEAAVLGLVLIVIAALPAALLSTLLLSNGDRR